MPQSSISTHPFSDFLSFEKISEPPSQNQKMVNSVVYHPCTSRVTSRIHFFHIPLNYLGFYLSQFVELSLTCIFHLMWETFFQFMVLTFLENALNLCIFTHTLVPDSKLQVELFENLFPPIRNRWGKLRFALSKFNHKI